MRSPTRRLPALAALLLLAGGCGGAEQAPLAPTTPRTLSPISETVKVAPGGTGTLGFQVRGPSGATLGGALVTFAIIDDAAASSQGATLAAASAVTNAQGECEAHITAGLAALFRVRATSADATADVVIVVGAGTDGSIDVAPFFPAPAGAHAAVVSTTIEVQLLDNRSCGEIDVRDPPASVRRMRSLPASGAVARYDFVPTNIRYAIVGRARDGRGGIRALGCVDLAGSALVAGDAVQIALPLVDAGPDPEGIYEATSPLRIVPPLAAAAPLAATWRDLTDCPLDPAQLWLDCTIDALGQASAEDPLDCVPATAPGGDGVLGDALSALRGTALAGPDGAPTACRGSKTSANAISIDAVVQGMFGSPLPRAFVQLAEAATDAAHLFDGLQLRSTLEVRGAGSLSAVTVTHTLTRLTFDLPSGTTDVSLGMLGVPVLTATTTGTITDDVLTIAQHGFTVRLGTAARAAFGSGTLARRGLPVDAAGVVAAIAGLARSDDGTLAGCVAVDDELCPRVGRAAGCLVTACATGLNALTARLDASFAAADGTDLDLYLSGSAPLLETHDDGLVGQLGDLRPGEPAGTWNVELRPRGGRRTLTSPWAAVRSGN